MPAIVVEGLERSFDEVKAVQGVDLEVSAGEIYGFLGPNGAGKSTTVHVLTTLIPPTDGKARVAGYDVVTQGSEVREHIGAAAHLVRHDDAHGLRRIALRNGVRAQQRRHQ